MQTHREAPTTPVLKTGRTALANIAALCRRQKTERATTATVSDDERAGLRGKRREQKIKSKVEFRR